jgi:hypothetical protein
MDGQFKEVNPENLTIDAISKGLKPDEFQENSVSPIEQRWQPSQVQPRDLVANRTQRRMNSRVATIAIVFQTAALLFVVGVGGITVWSLPLVLTSILMDLKVFLFYGAPSRPRPASHFLEPSREGEHIVKAWIEVGGKITGADKGVLWFDENAIWFNGDRSWFCFPRQNLCRPGSLLRGELDNIAEDSVVEVHTGFDRLRIGFQKAPVLRGVPMPHRGDLKAELEAFEKGSDLSPCPLQLPPLGPDPTYGGRFGERPDSKPFRALMTHPVFSLRYYWGAAGVFAIAMNTLQGATAASEAYGLAGVTFGLLGFSIPGQFDKLVRKLSKVVKRQKKKMESRVKAIGSRPE